MTNPLSLLMKLWSNTSFTESEISAYAKENLVGETRIGLMTMCIVLFFMIIAALPISYQLNLHSAYLYTYSLNAALAIHIFVSAKNIDDLQTLNLLGVTLLTISATAFVSIAHETNSFSFLLFTNVVVLFMTIPMVPWGLREASMIMLILYVLLTLSTGGMVERFGYDNLLILQFLMVTTALISLVIVARSVSVRKDDLSARYNLEKTQQHLFELSNTDPLTNAYNRRFLRQAYNQLCEDHGEEYSMFHFIIMDIDDFKIHNDKHGHLTGDEILKIIGEVINEKLNNKGYLIRFGGDEFVIIIAHQKPLDYMERIKELIKTKCRSLVSDDDLVVEISFGITSGRLIPNTDLDELYLFADKVLYDNKRSAKDKTRQSKIIHHNFHSDIQKNV